MTQTTGKSPSVSTTFASPVHFYPTTTKQHRKQYTENENKLKQREKTKNLSIFTMQFQLVTLNILLRLEHAEKDGLLSRFSFEALRGSQTSHTRTHDTVILEQANEEGQYILYRFMSCVVTSPVILEIHVGFLRSRNQHSDTRKTQAMHADLICEPKTRPGILGQGAEFVMA